ncbi:ribosomal-protein-alanine N-acetyltransferase [Cnuella takakiae]|uniref:Ribosomal-protein-alanine N-acetyltransferase n=1 Tax=Cnuella takakiae TaxID=1302690 RepID=A0A1M5B3X9_9BACT|nr:GNAT family protein [Cnuella takakiae]OLY93326.1 hypothetical protein BUE76_16615 [Cnuella takakiae]SHF37158.1 ribosomal-protein-alanine N-acetyltransferase [Cnuella takakiae]
MDTHRFSIEPFTASDQDFVFEGLSHPDVIRYYGVQFHTYEAARLQMEWFEQITREQSGKWWKIISKDQQVRVGAIGMNNYQPQHRCTEIGYWLLPRYWKQGILREVMPVFLHHLFRDKMMHRVAASVEVGNDASNKVLRFAGFHYEGMQRECEYKKGKFISLMWYSLLEEEWRQGQMKTEQ